MLPESHPEHHELLRLQLENLELAQWKSQLQNRINVERSDILRLKDLLKNSSECGGQVTQNINNNNNNSIDAVSLEEGGYERIVAHYLKENSLLEQKKNMLVHEIFEENIELIHLQVDLAIQNFKI